MEIHSPNPEHLAGVPHPFDDVLDVLGPLQPDELDALGHLLPIHPGGEGLVLQLLHHGLGCDVVDAVMVTRVTLKLLESIRLGQPVAIEPAELAIPDE